MEWYCKKRIPRLFGGSEIDLDQFVSSRLFLPESPEPEIKLDNVYKFYNLYLSLIIISLIVLIYEIIRDKAMKKLIESEKQIKIISEERLRRKRRMKVKKSIRRKIEDFYDKIINPVIVV